MNAMRELNQWGHYLIIIFVLWHMVAITVFAIPSMAIDPWSRWLRSHIQPYVEPYLFLTSQWQQWNPAAPDPGSRVTFFVIEQQRGNEPWQKLTAVSPTTIAWHRRFPEYRIASALQNSPLIIRQQYLNNYCQLYHLPVHTHLRMVYQWYDLPTSLAVRSPQLWNTWLPQWHSQPQFQTVCDH